MASFSLPIRPKRLRGEADAPLEDEQAIMDQPLFLLPSSDHQEPRRSWPLQVAYESVSAGSQLQLPSPASTLSENSQYLWDELLSDSDKSTSAGNTSEQDKSLTVPPPSPGKVPQRVSDWVYHNEQLRHIDSIQTTETASELTSGEPSQRTRTSPSNAPEPRGRSSRRNGHMIWDPVHLARLRNTAREPSFEAPSLPSPTISTQDFDLLWQQIEQANQRRERFMQEMERRQQQISQRQQYIDQMQQRIDLHVRLMDLVQVQVQVQMEK